MAVANILLRAERIDLNDNTKYLASFGLTVTPVEADFVARMNVFRNGQELAYQDIFKYADLADTSTWDYLAARETQAYQLVFYLLANEAFTSDGTSVTITVPALSQVIEEETETELDDLQPETEETTCLQHPDLILFVARAQARIADIGTYIIHYNNYKDFEIGIELYHAVDLIANCCHDIPEKDLLQIAHKMTTKANLYELPVLELPALVKTKIITGNSQQNGILPYHRHPYTDIDGLEDYIAKLVAEAVAALPNQLDNVEYAWVRANARPFTAPAVNLSVSYPFAPENGFYRKGVALAPIRLTPNIELNGGKRILALRLKANNELLLNRVDSGNFTAGFTDPAIRYQTVTYKLEVDFEIGGTRSAQITVPMIAPFYVGILTPEATSNQILALSPQQLAAKKESLQLVFPYDAGKKPVMAHPAEWGEALEITLSGFPTKIPANWRIWRQEITLHEASNTKQEYIFYQWLGSHNQAFTYYFIFAT